jgi:DNA-binding transcriptional regulator LsrR (DeoR family)
MARIDELRLLTKVARLYYERGLRQAAIADQLNLSQATISRLLKRAEEERLVRTTVSVPLGAFPELEEKLQAIYNLKDVVVVDSVADDDQALRDIGAAAAFYVETTVKRGEVVGISSWSATLLAMVDAMHPLPKSVEANVVQILGGIGDPVAEAHATHLSQRLAALMHGKAVFLPAPGVAGTAETRQVYLNDPFVREAMALFESVSLALVGIGSVEPSRLLASSGNVFSPEELGQLKAQGAVGDVCLRFFDSAGLPVITPLNDRVIGISLEQLRQAPRTVGIAGGERKLAAIRGALEGGWINVLITDRHTAEKLIPRVGGGVALPELADLETKPQIH